jgi:hypothetical protein
VEMESDQRLFNKSLQIAIFSPSFMHNFDLSQNTATYEKSARKTRLKHVFVKQAFRA